MKNATMISRRSFLKAAMAASAVSALALTGCGGSASSTAAASSAASSTAASAAAEGGQTFKVGIVNYVDHASLNQIVESVESRLDELGKEKGVTFDYADYYSNAQPRSRPHRRPRGLHRSGSGWTGRPVRWRSSQRSQR